MPDLARGHVVQSRLGFSIWLPDGWRVVEEVEEAEDPAEEARARFERWHASWSSSLSREDRELIAWGSEVGAPHLIGLLEHREPGGLAALETHIGLAVTIRTHRDPEVSRAGRALMLLTELDQRRQDSARVEPLGLLTAWLRIETAEDQGLPDIEISRYRFKRPLDAISFYEAAKPSQWDLAQGNRSSHTYSIDEMEAVRFYCQFAIEPARRALLCFAAVNDTGWQFDCWAEAPHFDRLKPIFIEIAESFRRSR
ncbi:MAG: hypothetical protein ABSC51_12210 [Gaiellaceae bacterium]